MSSATAASGVRPAYLPAVLVEGATFTLAAMSLTGAASHWLLGIGFGWPQVLAAFAAGAALTYAFRHDIKRA